MTLTPNNAGWIEVICGPMFSGKTEELIRRLVRAQIAKQKVAIFKPTTDNRFGGEYIVSHNQRKINSIQESKSDNKCPDCNYEIKENSKFCRMCGKFPIV